MLLRMIWEKIPPARLTKSTSFRRFATFGRRFDWADSLTVGFARSRKEQKPVMLVIHATECSACQQLKTSFVSDKALLALSKKFVMISAADEEEPKQDIFQPDGQYYPRILFISPCGNVMKEIVNETREKGDAQYFYTTTVEIKKSMDEVLRRLQKY